jgi:hypothetical protein
MRWGENKNIRPMFGTDIESVVPPNLGWSFDKKARCDATELAASLTLFSQLVG